jgi:protein gp37
VAEDSKIEWTTHTFNCWRGCTKVSEGCKHCYAETLSGRNPGTLGVWGPNGTRVVAAEAQWKLPVKWNVEAARAGERHRVFCASLADVFEDWAGPMAYASGNLAMVGSDGEWFGKPADWKPSANSKVRTLTMDDVRLRLFKLIDETPNLDWLLLTKRPENITPAMIYVDQRLYDRGPMRLRPNVWLGTSVENQAAADERIPLLLRTPAAVRFLSCEPLLGPVDLSNWWGLFPADTDDDGTTHWGQDTQGYGGRGIHWVIVGGESGPGARPMHPAWARSLRDQCRAAGVAFFFKQWGAYLPYPIRDWAKDDQVWLGDVNVYRHGAAAKRYEPELQRKLDGRTWDEFPGVKT